MTHTDASHPHTPFGTAGKAPAKPFSRSAHNISVIPLADPLTPAYKVVKYIKHRDGTSDTEVVDLYCESCVRDYVWKEVLHGPGEFPVSDRAAREVRRELDELPTYESGTLRGLWDAAMEYIQAQGDACPHILQRYGGTEPDKTYPARAEYQRRVGPRTLRVLDSDSAKYRDFRFSSYEDAGAVQEVLQWLEPEPAVGSAILEDVDVDKMMREWEQFLGKTPTREE